MLDSRILNAVSCAVNGFFAYHWWNSDPHIAGFALGVALWCAVDFLKALGETK